MLLCSASTWHAHPACPAPSQVKGYIDRKRSDIEDIARATLGFDAIYKAEGLTLSREEVEQEMNLATRQFQAQGQEFDSERLLEQVTQTLEVRGNAIHLLVSP